MPQAAPYGVHAFKLLISFQQAAFEFLKNLAKNGS